jgi:hypothetical protein
MEEPLNPDEEVVLRELLRLDLEPHQVPPALYEGFLKRLAVSAGISLPRTRAALQGLNDKGRFDTVREDPG